MSDIIEEIYGDNLKRARAEARDEGLKEGRVEGLKQGMDEGLKRGRSEGKTKILQNLNEMLQNNCSIDDTRNMISKEIENSPV